jgi:hypothetical protein
MTKLKILSAALIAAAMLAPAMAHESGLNRLHRAEDANASTGARYTGEGDGFRRSRFGGGVGGPSGDGYGGYGDRANGLHGGPHGYEGRDVWGHWGTYYGPMIPTVP